MRALGAFFLGFLLAGGLCLGLLALVIASLADSRNVRDSPGGGIAVGLVLLFGFGATLVLSVGCGALTMGTLRHRGFGIAGYVLLAVCIAAYFVGGDLWTARRERIAEMGRDANDRREAEQARRVVDDDTARAKTLLGAWMPPGGRVDLDAMRKGARFAAPEPLGEIVVRADGLPAESLMPRIATNGWTRWDDAPETLWTHPELPRPGDGTLVKVIVQRHGTGSTLTLVRPRPAAPSN